MGWVVEGRRVGWTPVGVPSKTLGSRMAGQKRRTTKIMRARKKKSMRKKNY